jgi:hypothetical protein
MADDAELANPPLTDVPAALAAILMRYDAASRRDAMKNWTLIGADGQRDYDRYLAHTLPGWPRRQRARKLARRLITGMD